MTTAADLHHASDVWLWWLGIRYEIILSGVLHTDSDAPATNKLLQLLLRLMLMTVFVKMSPSRIREQRRHFSADSYNGFCAYNRQWKMRASESPNSNTIFILLAHEYCVSCPNFYLICILFSPPTIWRFVFITIAIFYHVQGAAVKIWNMFLKYIDVYLYFKYNYILYLYLKYILIVF